MTTIAPELNLPSDHPLRQILDTIAAHPEVREPVLRVLLTEAFLALPARMDALTEQVQGLREEFDGFRQETREQFRSVHERIDETNRRPGRAYRRNRVLGERIDESSRDVINQMNGSIGRLRGETYERKCAEKIDTILVDHFLYAVEYDRTAIVDRLVQARHDRLISRAEYQDARNVDIVAQEKAGYDEDQHLAVVEVSITFNREDLETAARRAAIVGRVFGLRTDAFVATNGPWPDEVNEVARPLGVTIIRYFLPEFAAL
jgi:hypothetical protein